VIIDVGNVRVWYVYVAAAGVHHDDDGVEEIVPTGDCSCSVDVIRRTFT